MSKKLKFIACALCATVAVGMIGFTACEGAVGKDGKDGKSAYDIWLEQGNTGSEQDFLDSLKGAKGDQGDDALGSGWCVENTAPTESDGSIGDLWLNSEDGHVWYKEADGWKDLGSLKKEAAAPEEVLVKNFNSISLKSGEASTLDLSNVANGKYFLIVETSSEAKANTLISKTHPKGSTVVYENYDMYAPVSKTYKSFVNKGDDTVLELTASEDMTVNAKLVELGSVPTITAEGGKAEFEVPALTSANAGGLGGLYVVKLDETLAGKKGVTITVETDYIAKIYVNAANDYETTQSTSNSTTLKQFDAAPFTATIDIPDNGYIYIRSNRLHLNANVHVTIQVN